MHALFKIFLIGVGSLLMLGAQCNRGVQTTGTEGEEDGTVSVEGCTGADNTSSLKIEQNPATRISPTSSFKMRIYDVKAATNSDCAAAEASGSFVSIIDGGSDTSDCRASMDPNTYALSTFTEIVGGASLGEGTSIPPGEYHCLRFTFCDHIYWESTNPAVQNYCQTTKDIQDIDRCYDDPTTGQEVCFYSEETDGVATIRAYYASTTGLFDVLGNENSGTAEVPAALANPLVVQAGQRTTISFVFSSANSEGAVDEGIFVYDQGQSGSDCRIPPPAIKIVQETAGTCSAE